MGAHTIGGGVIDLVLLSTIGPVGFGMRRYGLPVPPAAIGVVLGPATGRRLRRARQVSDGSGTAPIGTSPPVIAYAVVVLLPGRPPVHGVLRCPAGAPGPDRTSSSTPGGAARACRAPPVRGAGALVPQPVAPLDVSATTVASCATWERSHISREGETMRDTRLLRSRTLPLLGLLAALLLPLGLTAAPGASAAPAATPVRVMPLGDSITGSPGCWRALLWNRLLDAGHTDVDFVGTLPAQGCGVQHDGDNEGHGGELATNVADQRLLPARLAATRPDIVVMHFGTNDVWSSVPPDRILAAYTELVAQMRASNPRMRVLVAQIIPMNPGSCAACAQRVVDFNARIPAWAAATSTGTSPVTVVDQWTGFDTATDTYDGVHPNAAGDGKIAARWFPALSAALEETGEPGDPGGPGDPGAPVCTASFRTVSAWQGGHQAEVTVTNTSAAPVTGWTVTVAPADGARVTQVWNGTLRAAADGTVTVTDAGWNGTLAPGASTAFGLIAAGGATSAPPAATVDCTATP